MAAENVRQHHPAEPDSSAAAGAPGGQPAPLSAEYRELLSLYSNDIILLFDDQFRILDCNERAPEAYGYDRDGLLTLTLDDLRAADDPVALEDREASVRRRRNAIFESNHKRSDGSTFPVETSIRVVETEGGSYYHATVRDISERTAANDALKGTRALLETLVEGTSDAVYVKDREGRYLLFNAAAERITGKRAADALGKDDRFLFSAEEAAVVMAADREIMESKAPATYEETVTDAAGKRSTFLSTKGPMYNDDGEFLGLFGIARDVTARKEAEEALRASKATLEAALASMTDAVVISDVDGRFIEFNEAFATFHRFASKAECAKTLAEYPEFLDVFLADGSLASLDQWAVPRALRGETAINAEYTLRLKDTGETWIGSYNFGPIRDAEGEIVGSVVVGRDITEQKRVLSALQLSEAKFSMAFHTSPDSVNLNRLSDGFYLDISDGFTETTGFTQDDVAGKTSADIAIWVDQAERDLLVAGLQADGIVRNMAMHFRAKDGSLGIGLMSARTIDIEGEQYILSITRDISERVRMQDELAQVTRLYATLSQINQAIVRIKEPTELYRSVCDVAVEFGEFALAWVGLLDEASGDVRPAAAHGFDLTDWPFGVMNLHRGIFKDGPAGAAIRTGQVVVLKDTPGDEQMPAARGRMRDRGLRSSAAVPFRLKGKTTGVLVLLSGEAALFEATAELSLLEEIGLDISFALDAMAADAERTLTEEALGQSSAQLRTLIDTLPDLIWLKDPEGAYLSCNRRFESFFGAAEKDIVGKTDYDFIDADLADSFRRHDQAAMVAGGPTANEEQVVFAGDGHREVLETVKMPVRATDGHLIGVLGVSRDITERKQAEDAARRQAEQLRRTVEGAVLAMSHMVESRDPYTAGHERRVAELAAAIGAEMGMAGDELDALRLAGTIHDVGKIAVPAEILSKPGHLNEMEFALIQAHPTTGFDILAEVDFGRPVAEMVLEHHERLDGSGYPRGLKGEEILAEARILAVADVVEAMSSHRPYRAALGMDVALAEVREHARVTFDADVVASCVRLIEEKGFLFTP